MEFMADGVKEKGFSMLELLLTGGMLAVFLLFAVPALHLLAVSKVQFEAAELTANLRYLQMISWFRQGRHEYFPRVEGEPGVDFTLNPGAHYYQLSGGTKTLRRQLYPAEMMLSIDSANIRNIKFGKSGDTSPVTLQVQLDGSRRFVILDRAGRIRMERR